MAAWPQACVSLKALACSLYKHYNYIVRPQTCASILITKKCLQGIFLSTYTIDCSTVSNCQVLLYSFDQVPLCLADLWSLPCRVKHTKRTISGTLYSIDSIIRVACVTLVVLLCNCSLLSNSVILVALGAHNLCSDCPISNLIDAFNSSHNNY